MFEKLNLPQSLLSFSQGFICPEFSARLFRKDRIFSFDFSYHRTFSIMKVFIYPLFYYTMDSAKYFIFVIVIIVTGIVLFLVNKFSVSNSHQDTKQPFSNQLINNSNNMQITSTAFKNNGNIPTKYTCDGEGISPPLLISDVPKDTTSLALILHDPDAPVAGGFTHWIIFNMPPDTKDIEENSKPLSSVEGTNSSGKTGYTGPCPPSGTHHYEFRLYALDEKLNFDASASKIAVEKAIAGHILSQALLVGLYQRQ